MSWDDCRQIARSAPPSRGSRIPGCPARIRKRISLTAFCAWQIYRGAPWIASVRYEYTLWRLLTLESLRHRKRRPSRSTFPFWFQRREPGVLAEGVTHPSGQAGDPTTSYRATIVTWGHKISAKIGVLIVNLTCGHRPVVVIRALIELIFSAGHFAGLTERNHCANRTIPPRRKVSGAGRTRSRYSRFRGADRAVCWQ
jgi:hypothetical protein